MAKHYLSKVDAYAKFSNIVVIPFFLVVFYYVLLASDRYISESTFTVMEIENTASNLGFGLLKLGGASGYEDERIIKEYIISLDLLLYLDKEIKLREHYQSSGADFFSSLSDSATQEEFLEYYRDHIDVSFDEMSGLLRLEVQAFNRDYAANLLKIILAKAENKVNEINHELAIAQYKFVDKQMYDSKAALKLAKKKLLSFQNKHQIFSPEFQGQSLALITETLESDISREKANLKMLRNVQNDSSSSVILSRERIKALTSQLVDEKRKLTGESDTELNSIMMEYTDYKLEFEFATEAYAAALLMLDKARSDSAKKLKHMIVVSVPSYADEAKYPDKPYILITVLMVLLMTFGVIRMSVTTVREHLD